MSLADRGKMYVRKDNSEVYIMSVDRAGVSILVCLHDGIRYSNNGFECDEDRFVEIPNFIAHPPVNIPEATARLRAALQKALP